jgi:hypothetical protein
VTTSKQNTQSKDQQILAGIQKDLQNVPSLLLGGTTYTPGSLAAFIQSRIDAVNAVITAKANWATAVQTYKTINAEAKPVVRDLRNFVVAAFGEASPVLADFGFIPARTPATEPHIVGPLKGGHHHKHKKGGATKGK